MLLTVSGPPGGGKSTTAANLAEYFGLEHISGGDVFRSVAAERGLTLAEFNALAEEDESIDHDLDRRLSQIAHERDDVVIESRLAGWLAGDRADVRLWLDAPIEVRSERIAEREGEDADTVLEQTRAREDSEEIRYRTYYGIEIGDRSIYDVSLNTARWSPEAVLEILTTAIDSLDPSEDEGQVPIDAVQLED